MIRFVEFELAKCVPLQLPYPRLMHSEFSETIIVSTNVFRAWSFSKGKFHCQVLAETLLLLGWAHEGKKDLFKTSEFYHEVRKRMAEVWYLE